MRYIVHTYEENSPDLHEAAAFGIDDGFLFLFEDTKLPNGDPAKTMQAVYAPGSWRKLEKGIDEDRKPS